MNKVQTDPYELPRPYPMVCAILEATTGARITPQRARQLEQAAFRKLAAGLAGLMFPPDPHVRRFRETINPTTKEARP